MPKLGKYKFDEDARLGSGGEGDVYKGKDAEVCAIHIFGRIQTQF